MSRQAHLWYARQFRMLDAKEDTSKQNRGYLQGMLAEGGDVIKAPTAAFRQGSAESPLKVAVELAAVQPAKLEAAAVPEVMQANVIFSPQPCTASSASCVPHLLRSSTNIV